MSIREDHQIANATIDERIKAAAQTIQQQWQKDGVETRYTTRDLASRLLEQGWQSTDVKRALDL